jgi:hypothetical protein
MDTLDLIDKRIRSRLDRINSRRARDEKEEVRVDLDTPLRGYLQLREEFVYHFRVGMRFDPLLTVEVTYRNNVYYFGVRPDDQAVWQVLKHPPERDPKRNESFWLSTELDLPLEAIEKHMESVLT